MGKLIKDLKKGGFAGACAKYRLKYVGLGLFLMAVTVIMCCMSGEFGLAAGASLAIIPAITFKVPEDAEFSEEERKSLNLVFGALSKQFTEQFKSFAEGSISEKDVLAKMDEKLKAWGEENGISKEKLEKMSEMLKEQGKTLTSLKEQGAPYKNSVGLKAAFDKEYDNLVSAIKNKRSGFVIKSVDEHSAGKIQTTGNSISTTSGAQLSDSVEYSDQVFMKRRGREYIHDIANVTQVSEVPETFVFDEEGAEDGAIAVVAENGLKPQVHLSLVRNQVSAKKAAGYIVVTEEMIKWRSRLWAQIQRLFRDKVARDYEQLLTTDLMKNAVSYTTTPLDGTIDAPTDFDAIIAGVLQLENLEYMPDVLVINPADKWKLAMTETKNGTLILPYIQQGGEFSLLGLRVITTTRVEAGTFIIGESGTWFIEEESPRLRTGLVNDDFLHNRMTVIGELFFLSYVPSNNAGSFVKGSFSTIKESLKKTTASVSEAGQ